MAQPIPPDPVAEPGRVGREDPERPSGCPETRGRRLWDRLASLALVLEIALALRILAADAVEWYVRGQGPDRLCVFPDTQIYWELARALRAGGPYEIVEWSDIPHFALRTPGYPLVLAACQSVFGERTLAVRLVQAVLGTVSVYLVYGLTRRLTGDSRSGMGASRESHTDPTIPAGKDPSAGSGGPTRGWTIPLAAAALAAVNPYSILMSALILSEAVFEPLMLASLLGLAVLWNGCPAGAGARRAGGRTAVWALGTGAAAGAAVLVRPSWALFVPMMLAAWVVASLARRRGVRAAARGAGLCALGIVLVMGPWWYRNWQVYGRFVPTALWFGASLYDGLNPDATGASDMAFRGHPDIWPLDEQDQDAELSRRAWAFARQRPWRVLGLAVVKLGRYWSPWPHAAGFRGLVLGLASAAVELPLFGLIALGLWDRRRDLRAGVLLAGPVLYFAALHTVFASSMRYRIPGEIPALGLAAIGGARLATGLRRPVLQGRRSDLMRIGRRMTKVLFWGFVLCLSILAGGLWFAYTYVTDSETAARLIKHYALRYLPRSVVDLSSVRFRPLTGELTLNQVHVRQAIDGAALVTLRIPWLHLGVNPRKLIRGQLDVREVLVSQPALRLCHRRDGTWNLQGFLANPRPGPWLANTPPIVIRNGALELIPDEEPPGDVTAPGTASPPAKNADDATSRGMVILREVNLRIDQVAGRMFRFEGSARGDFLDRLQLNGTIDLETGGIALDGNLTGLTLSEGLRRRIPLEARPVMRALALHSGVTDIDLKQLRYDPRGAAGNRLHYTAMARLREGVWECPHLPFPVNDLAAEVSVEDAVLTIHRAEGFNGSTVLRAAGTLGVCDPRREPMDLHIGVTTLELDPRLRSRTPAEYDDLWDVFQPRGQVDAELHVARAQRDGPVELGATVSCRDVSANYRHFPYQLDHLTGQLVLERNRLTVDVGTSSVGGPLRLKGTIENPGIDAVVQLDIQAESVPVDKKLFAALKDDVRAVVDQFEPRGTVKAHATVHRRPMAGRPEGWIAIDAEVDLSEQCEIRWAGLKYPVRNLTGRLELHPDEWIFKDMRGRNGQADITASGRVEKLPGRLRNGDDRLKVRVDLRAWNLPFSEELRTALPAAWDKVWKTINPSGTCDVEATVDTQPDKLDRTHIVIVPLPESNARLEFMRTPQPNVDPGGPVELRMDDVHGRFVFDNGMVTMNDVHVQFRGAPVQFSQGTVFVEDTGRFGLSVDDLWIKDLRLDRELRMKMPPLMAQFAQRLDDGRTFTARGNLQIGWSGMPGQPAWCAWEKTLVVLNDNTLKTGIPLEHIQGELDNVSGWSNGLGLKAQGIVKLESVILLGQQITRVESPFRVQQGVAELGDVRGRFLGGALWGRGWVSLANTPRYGATLSLHAARLEEYARTLGGRRPYRGALDARLEWSGLGSDPHTLEGQGEAHLTQGDLGELPVVLRFAKFLNIPLALSDAPRVRIKTMFDSADVAFTIAHGVSTLDPIKFTGNAFSLQGRGTLDPQANLDLRLKVLLGRDRWHVPLFSDVAREASGQFFIVHVTGTPSYPRFRLEALPQLQREVGRLERQEP